jgi:6-phosphogluconolactonase (cycloisomerase 2 family)
MSAMIDKSIYFFNLNDDNEITNINKIEVNERVRDMAFKNNKLYLFMEDSASIGIIELSIP